MARVFADEDFPPAPAGRRVVRVTIFVVLLLVVVTTVFLVQLALRPPPSKFAWMWLLHLIAPSLVSAIWYGARIHGYSLSDGQLLVRRAWLKRRFPLGEFTGAELDPEALKGARKQVGNDGLGAIAGSFTSKKLGRFRAYVSDPERCVVLRGSGQPLVISPRDPEAFVQSLRRRLGT